ncbi:MAG: hypothetical protein JF615_15450 [Asticcacaulis sp.]|nr:hypothetical protein [Asticcacaulis sp.]
MDQEQTPSQANDAASASTNDGPSMTLQEAEELGHSLKKLLVRSRNELVKGDAREKVEQLERWVESYRRGLSAAHKISTSGVEMLTQARNQLHLALEEQLRIEDEGGCTAEVCDQTDQIEQLNAAIRRMDRLIPVVEDNFQTPAADADTTTKKPEAA